MIDVNWNALGALALEVGLVLLWVALILAVGFWLARLVGLWVRRSLSKQSMGWNGTVLVSRLASITIRVASVMIALSILGVSGTGLLAVASAFTVAIGLSLQDVMKNFFAGIYLLLERPFKVGDRIVVKDVSGEVQGIDIRTTLVKNMRNELVLVPNATIFTEILRNDTHFGVRRLDFTIKSETRSLDQIEENMQRALNDVEGVKRPIPAPQITTSEPSLLSVTCSLVIENQDGIQNRVTHAVIAALPGDTVEISSS